LTITSEIRRQPWDCQAWTIEYCRQPHPRTDRLTAALCSPWPWPEGDERQESAIRSRSDLKENTANPSAKQARAKPNDSLKLDRTTDNGKVLSSERKTFNNVSGLSALAQGTIQLKNSRKTNVALSSTCNPATGQLSFPLESTTTSLLRRMKLDQARSNGSTSQNNQSCMFLDWPSHKVLSADPVKQRILPKSASVEEDVSDKHIKCPARPPPFTCDQRFNG